MSGLTQKQKLEQFPAQIKTPVEILTPVDTMDHGLSLVHDMTGAPRNYLHEVSVRRHEQDAIRYLMAAGYAQRCGWVAKDGTLYWTYSKPFPLTVAAWCEVSA
jgi:hypothetical protein